MSKASVEKLNRKKLDANGKKTAKAKAPAKKAVSAKGPSPESLAHRRLLVVLGGLVKYGSLEQQEKAAADLSGVAVKLIAAGEKMSEDAVRAYLAQPPSRFLPTGYKNLKEHGTPVKDALH